MGIEKFFNALRKRFGEELVRPVGPAQTYEDEYLLLDFNSIVHVAAGDGPVEPQRDRVEGGPGQQGEQRRTGREGRRLAE